MGEIKSVKVDNWGVFFLQKLQNFFNKTDFCDLTLQFKDNSQLKVHRLVLSACTDFFNVLEQTCELMDDALVMPAELQADVVVPIVNFMYTGTLEFELKMYGKLLRTAKEMNMTVLLKLLEAHKRTMEGTRATTVAPNQTPKKPRIPPNQNTKVIQSPQTVKVAQPQSQRIQIIHSITPQRRTVMKPVQDRNTLKPAAAAQTILKPAPRLQRGPTRFEEPTSTHSETYESSFDSISYESKPLKEEPDEYTDEQTTTQWNRSSPFEQLRKGFNNNKRPAVATFTSPPAKKPNIEDVKEFSEQQRMRKQIAAEFGDDAEFDSIMDDEFHNDDDDEEPPHHHVQNTHPSSSSTVVKQLSRQQQQNQHSSVIIKQSPNEKPTIVVKDSSNSKMDHAKLISEVLRQYPHLVKSNKNIKLKIMPNVGGQSQKIIVKKETIDNMSAEMEQNNQPEKPQSRQTQFGLPKQQQQQMHQQSIIKKPLRSYTASQTVKVENQASVSNALKNTTNEAKPAPSSAPQKRRIDSKTMHALIAQGAENTTGPWLCLRCGVNGRPISIPSYRGFRRHLINTHKETIDSALCEHCGWRSKTNRELHHHMLVEHQVASLLYTFVQCKECNKICLNENDLQAHSEQYHPDSHKQQCIYCNKVFLKEMALYTHMKTFHKKRAREDGVIDFSDDEMDLDLESARSGRATSASGDSKIKILSDISLPSTLLKLENPVTTEEDDYGNDSGPKFVNADGNEMVLTAEQREEIMSQLDQDHDGGVVMVLNESVFPPEEAEGEGGGLVKLEAGETEHPIDFDEQNSQFLAASDIDLRGTEMSTEEHVGEETISKDAADEEATHADEQEENQESDDEHENDNDEHLDDDDHMEWAENLISAHDAHDDEEIDEHKDAEEKENEGEKLKKQKDEKDVKEKEKVSLSKSPKEDKPDAKKAEDINLKLKMLTGDWSDDEIDEEDETNEELPKDQEKTEEPETTATSKKSESDQTKPDDIEIKQSESMEEYGHEPELDANNSLIADDEITQSSHSEKVEEEHEIKEEVEEDVQLEPAVNEDIVSESEVSAPATEEKAEESISEQVKDQGRTSRRTSSNKESDLNKTPSEDSSDAKTKTITAKTAEDETDKTESVDKEKETISTAADDEEANTSAKSVEEESSTTPDKVKSLLNEWVDDDDDL